jgi:conjugal transfer/type IV secretion protein DotA/TraY
MALGQIDQATADARTRTAEATYDHTIINATQAAVAAANALNVSVLAQHGDWTGLGFQNLFATSAAVDEASATSVTKTTAPPRGANGDAKPSGGDWSKYLTVDFYMGIFNDMMMGLVDKLGVYVAGIISSFSGQSPITAMQHFGVNVIKWFLEAYAATIAVPIVASMLVVGIIMLLGVAPNSMGSVAATFFTSNLAMVASKIQWLLGVLGIPLLWIGFKMAAILPFMIASAWLGAIFGWLAVVIESLFGAPLWAIVHLDTDGEGMGQRTAHGYLFLLNLIFRPILLVGALAVAQLAMTAMFGMFGSAIAGMITAMTGNSSQWAMKLLLIIGALFVIVTFAEHITAMCLGLLSYVPDKVFAFVGGQFGSDLGASSNLQGNLSRVGVAGEGYATQRAIEGASQRGTAAKEKLADAKMARKQAQVDAMENQIGTEAGGTKAPGKGIDK